MLWEDAKAKDEWWQLAYERPTQKAGERKGAVRVERGFEQPVLHRIDDGLDDARRQLSSALDAGEVSNGHLPGLEGSGEHIGCCDRIHDGIVNAVAACRGHDVGGIAKQEQPGAIP